MIGRGGKTQWHGLPIFELYGPAIPSAFMNKKVQESLQGFIRDKFPAILSHEIEYLSLKR